LTEQGDLRAASIVGLRPTLPMSVHSHLGYAGDPEMAMSGYSALGR
jgi:hypothetical protein